MESAISDPKTAGRRRRAKKSYLILAAIAIVVAGGWGVLHWLRAGKQSTDDAQIEADVVPVAARTGGVIQAAKVRDNQVVKAGDVLFELDPADLDFEVARAEAELEGAREQQAVAKAQVAIVEQSSSGGLSSARAALTGAGAQARSAGDAVRAAEAAVAKSRAELATAASDLASAQQLFAKEAITRRDLEHAEQAHEVARAAVDAANAQLGAAREQRGLAQARISEAEGRVTQSAPIDQQIAAARAAAQLAAARTKVAEVALARAKLTRSYATVVAPVDGMISKLGAHPGQTIAAGQPLLMLVPNETYVVANFKETQISHMKRGDQADIEIDAYEGTFHGVIDTLSPATGSRFSLIQADNATGNFVKVVQRVPVKITWTQPPGFALRPGLSAEVTVHVDR